MNCKRVVVVAVLAALTLGACSSDKKTGAPAKPGGSGSASGAFDIYTAGAYKDIIDKLVKGYTATHKTAKITIVTNASPKTLKASYDKARPSVMVLINKQSKVLGDNIKATTLGQDRAVIAVTTANPKKVADVKAFATTSGVKTAMCGSPTGFGNTAFWVLLRSKIKVDARKVGAGCETTVMRDLKAKKIDAALVFRGRAFAPKGVKLLTIPDDQNIVFDLSYLPVGKTAAVTAFGTFLSSAGAKRILKLNGYIA